MARVKLTKSTRTTEVLKRVYQETCSNYPAYVTEQVFVNLCYKTRHKLINDPLLNLKDDLVYINVPFLTTKIKDIYKMNKETNKAIKEQKDIYSNTYFPVKLVDHKITVTRSGAITLKSVIDNNYNNKTLVDFELKNNIENRNKLAKLCNLTEDDLLGKKLIVSSDIKNINSEAPIMPMGFKI